MKKDPKPELTTGKVIKNIFLVILSFLCINGAFVYISKVLYGLHHLIE